jgi:hypothetical protein
VIDPEVDRPVRWLGEARFRTEHCVSAQNAARAERVSRRGGCTRRLAVPYGRDLGLLVKRRSRASSTMKFSGLFRVRLLCAGDVPTQNAVYGAVQLPRVASGPLGRALADCDRDLLERC